MEFARGALNTVKGLARKGDFARPSPPSPSQSGLLQLQCRQMVKAVGMHGADRHGAGLEMQRPLFLWRGGGGGGLQFAMGLVYRLEGRGFPCVSLH